MSRPVVRTYTEAELANFASYRDERAKCTPARCNNGPRCWVLLGPPALQGRHECQQCHGLPRMGPWYAASRSLPGVGRVLR